MLVAKVLVTFNFNSFWLLSVSDQCSFSSIINELLDPVLTFIGSLVPIACQKAKALINGNRMVKICQ